MDWLKAFQPPGRRQLLLVLLVTLGAVALSETALRRGWLDVVDTAYSDAWHRLAGMRMPPRHVALVTVDDAALKAHHDDPLVFWGPHLARAIERLRAVGARVIGLDLLLSMSPDGWLRHLGGEASDLARYHDAGLRAHIAAGDVVLVGSRGNGGGGYTLPHPDYLLAIPDLDLARHIGLADLHSDRDGVVRRFTGRSPPAADPALEGLEPPRLALAALLAERAGAAPGAAEETPRWITYVGPPGSIPRVSISRLEAPGFAQDPQVLALNGKVVIIGAYFSGMGDAHFTPYSTTFTPGGSLMSGAEVHANIVETLLSGRETRPLAGGPRLLLSGLSVLLLLGVMVRAGLTAGTLLGLALLVLAGATSYGAFERLWLVSAGAWQGSLLLGYMGGLGLMFTGEARRRAHLARVFRRYVSEAAVKVLLRSDTMPDLGGELCRVTVLFSDIRNFTTISEILTPAEVVEMLNEYFERACQPVLDEGGSIDKFIGDAIMAEFGAPMAAPDHALRAVRAALRMIETAEAFRGWMQHRFPGRGLPEFAIGVGIHTGEAILGSIGSRQRSEYTAIGDTVNVASRLEGVTKEMGIAIVASRATISAAGGAVRWGPCSVVHVKGHNQTIEVFGITGLTEGKIDA